MLNPSGPRLSVSVVGCERGRTAGRWRVHWRVGNEGDEPVVLESAWIPHGRFRGEGRAPIATTLQPGQSIILEFRVRAREPAETVVENAFLILRTSTPSASWRIFARMRIEFDREAVPRPIIEAITRQRVE